MSPLPPSSELPLHDTEERHQRTRPRRQNQPPPRIWTQLPQRDTAPCSSPRQLCWFGILADGSLWEWAPASTSLLKTWGSSLSHSNLIGSEVQSVALGRGYDGQLSGPGSCPLGSHLLVTDRPSASSPAGPGQTAVPDGKGTLAWGSESWERSLRARTGEKKTFQEAEVVLQLSSLFCPPRAIS